MRRIEVDRHTLVSGILLVGLWLTGLFWVLDAGSLVAKAAILIALVPLSLKLDELVSQLMPQRSLQPVRADHDTEARASART